MKKYSTASFALCLFCCNIYTSAAQEIRRPIKMSFQVVDDFNLPVANTEIDISTFHHWEPGEGFGRDVSSTFKGSTNADGFVTIQGEALRDSVSYGPRFKEGYYSGGDGRYRFSDTKNNRWEPWNPVIKITIKRIINPIPMYARKIGNGIPFEIPEFNKPFGFDLMIGDWVTPKGKGQSPDIIFTLTEITPFTVHKKPFNYLLAVTFGKAGDGIQSVLSANSALKTPRYAPEDGYEPKLEKQMAVITEGKSMRYETREDQNYLFRVRTVLDEQGRVKSALYGKIAGDIKFGVNRVLLFNYYLNPIPLDRNIEFDPQRNLFEKLHSLEKINEP